MIHIQNLTIRYGDHHVVNPCNLCFNKGIFYVITGQSGCGKSSILQVLGLLQKQTSDLFTIGEHQINHNLNLEVSLRKETIGYVFQEKNLHDSLTVFENLKTFAYLVNRSMDENKAKELLNTVHLDVPLNQAAYKLSGGEKQRLAVACALVKEPEILLSDEPSSGLDRENESLLIELLKRLAHEKKICVIVVSHSKRICDKADELLVIENKEIHQEGNEYKKEKIELKNKKVPWKFYFYYIFKSPSVKNKVYLFVSLLIAIVIGLMLSTMGIQESMVEANRNMINSITNNNLLVSYEEEFNDRDKEYYSHFEHVLDVQYYYHAFESGNVHVQCCYDDRLNEDEAMITYGYAKMNEIEIGDEIYLACFDHTFKVKEILTEKSLNDFSNINEKYVFIQDDYFNIIPTSQLILTLDSFEYINTVKQNIMDIKEDVIVFDATYQSIIYTQMQSSLIEYLALFSKALIGIVICLFIYVEVIDLLSHKYEFALLKANGLTNKELLKQLMIRSMIQGGELIIISIFALILFNSIYFKTNFTEELVLLNNVIYILPLVAMIKVISTTVMAIYLSKIDTLILIKK